MMAAPQSVLSWTNVSNATVNGRLRTQRIVRFAVCGAQTLDEI
jgi:hypothetical protein